MHIHFQFINEYVDINMHVNVNIFNQSLNQSVSGYMYGSNTVHRGLKTVICGGIYA